MRTSVQRIIVPGEISWCSFALVALLAITVSTSAAPTSSNCDRLLLVGTASPALESAIPSAPDTIQFTRTCDSPFISVSKEFLKPPIAFTNSGTALSNCGKSLPAGPAAFLLALTGFFCVTLVKDRKAWLAALAALLYVGQVGIDAVPKLMLHIYSKQQIEQLSSPKGSYVYELDNSYRLRSDAEGTRYIGLLHHLGGIPQTETAITATNQGGRINALWRAYKQTTAEKNPTAFASAIIQSLYNLKLSLSYLTHRVEQPVCFSSAFIFELIPRGPPMLA
jgi:hypothetical protein